MNITQNILPKGWKWDTLGNPNISIISAGGTPRRSVHSYYQGSIPWAKIGDLTKAGKYIKETEENINDDAILNSNAKVFPKDTVLVSMYGSIGKAAIGSIPIATNQAIIGIQLNRDILEPEYLYYFLTSIQSQLENLGRGATQNNINSGHIKNINIPIPPLPVQGRIVQILQKADEIRRKRQEAVAIADAILPAIFIDMFGTPEDALIQFGSLSLQELADVRSGVTKGRKLQGRETVEVPYLRVANVQDGYLDLSEIKTIEVLPTDVERYHLEDGDVLIIEGCGNPNYLGRGCIWREEIKGCIHQNHVFRIRCNRDKLLPELFASILRTKYANHYFLRSAKNSSGLSNINSTQVKAFQIPLIPIKLQQKFIAAVEQWNQAIKTLTTTYSDSEALRQSLLQQAFTGELTAEWEATNAQQIAAKQKFYQRLPQLVILSFLKKKISHIQRQKADTAVLVTALMKYVFLFQMEGAAKRRFYQFIPYHYGPFAKELYTDLETLQEQGLITVDDSDEDKTRISLLNSEAVEAALTELPADLQADIKAIIDSYGDLDLTSLLATVYEKYPAYAKKSKLKQRKPKPNKEEN